MITIIDYGLGNLGSVYNMLKKIGVPSKITSDKLEIEKAQKLILPGVGAFDNGMKNLRERGIVELLNYKVLDEKIPILGFCLGMQLLTKCSEEGEMNGLGWFDAQTIKFDANLLNREGNYKIPHMGWTAVIPVKNSGLVEQLPDEPRFYHVHSYHVVCENKQDILLTANYGYEFITGIEHENILGVQFHPEKSHKFGMKLLLNFNNNY